MKLCLSRWIFLFAILSCSIECLPISIGQDPETVDTLGYLAAGDYEEWRRCKGYSCRVWYGEQSYIQKIKCFLGDQQACSNKLSDHQTEAVEEDMFLTPEQVLLMWHESLEKAKHGRTKRSTGSGPNVQSVHHRARRKVTRYSASSKQWELPIQYKFDKDLQSVDNAIDKEILKAIQHWEKQTCITFKLLKPEAVMNGPHIVFTTGDMCGSYIGQIPIYPQPIQISVDCKELGSIAHEIGHAVGFWHEHQRTDRDNYVTIHGKNARTQSERVYSLELKGTTANLLPYDYGSLMHYRAWAFTKSGAKTIEPVDQMYLQTMGQKVGLSFLDAKLANLAYCQNSCPSPLPSTCQQSGYQDPNACHRCRCPDGLGGTYCQTVAPSKNGECSAEINLAIGESKKVNSPGYMVKQPYNNNVECNWIIRAPVGHRVLVKFQGAVFGVFCEPGVPVCFHWVEIKYHRDFSKTGPRLCCGGYPVLVMRSEGPELILTLRAFYDAPAIRRRGFQVTVTSEIDCGQHGGRVLPNENSNCTGNQPTSKTVPRSQVPEEPLRVISDANNQKEVEENKAVPCPAEAMHPVKIPLCSKMDLIILFDETWSPSVNFALVIQFLQDFISLLTLGPENVQVAFIVVGEKASIQFNFNQLYTKEQMIQAMSQLLPTRGKTNVVEAFDKVESLLSATDGGSRQNVEKVCLLFINSGSTVNKDLTEPKARRLRDSGVFMFVVGTSWANQNEMKIISGDENRSFFRSSMKLMLSDSMASTIHQAMCDIEVVDRTAVAVHPDLDSRTWQCTFDAPSGHYGTYCGMYQPATANSQAWRLTRRSELTNSMAPVQAHSGSYFISVQLSKSTTQTPAEIYLPIDNWGEAACLSFFVYYSAGSSDQLNVVLRSSDDKLQQTLLNLPGQRSDKGQRVQVKVPQQSCSKIVLVAVRDIDPLNDVSTFAIDSLSLSNAENCDSKENTF